MHDELAYRDRRVLWAGVSLMAALVAGFAWYGAAVLAVEPGRAALAVLGHAATIGCAAAVGLAAFAPAPGGHPFRLRVLGSVETATLAVILLVALFVLANLLGEGSYRIYRLKIDAVESLWWQGDPNDPVNGHLGQFIVAMSVGLLMLWLIVLSILDRVPVTAVLAPGIIIDVYLAWLTVRLLRPPVYHWGYWGAYVGLFSVAALGALISLRLVGLISTADPIRQRLAAGQAVLTIIIGAAAIVVLGRYVGDLGWTPLRAVGFLIVAMLGLAAAGRLAALRRYR